jgi:His-Xaa-Ser system protein HxsD
VTSFNEDHTQAILQIDKTVYSKAAVLRTCYALARDLAFQISEKDSGFEVTISLRTPKPTLAQPLVGKIDSYIPDFLNGLTDNQLRIEIQTETAAVRELIIAKAFAESGILEDAPPGTFEDPVSIHEDSSSLVKIAGAEMK